MYQVTKLIFETDNSANYNVSESLLVNEETAKEHKEVLPTIVGQTLTVKSFPISGVMTLTLVTKIN